MVAPIPGDGISRLFSTSPVTPTPSFRAFSTSQARATGAPKTVPETLKKLIQGAVIPSRLASSDMKARQVNDAYSWQVAQIGALFQALYHGGIATEKDIAQLKEHGRELQSLQKRIDGLDLSNAEKEHALGQIRSAQHLIEDAAILAKSLQQYGSLGEQFYEAESNLVDSSYEPYEAGHPLLALSHVEDAISGLHALWEPVAGCKNSEAPASKMFSLFSEDLRHLSYVVEDWADALSDSIAAEQKALTKWLDKFQDPKERQEAVSQLGSLRGQVKEVQEFVKRVGPQLDNLVKELKDYPQFRDDLTSLAGALKHASQATSAAQSKLSANLRGERAFPLQYGSEEWQEHIQLRPMLQSGFLTRAISNLTQPENWNDTTKRVMHGLFIGMQLSQQAIGIAAEAGRMKQMADQLQSDVIQAVPKDKAEQIERETSALGTFLNDKFEALKNPATFNTLTKRHEAIRPALQATLDAGQTPSTDQINELMGAYRLQRLVQESPQASPFQALSFGEWLDRFTGTEEIQTQEIAAAPLLLPATATGEDQPVTASAEKCNGMVCQFMGWLGSFWQAQQAPTLPAVRPSQFFEDKAHEIQSQLKEAISTTHGLQRDLIVIPGLEELRAQAALLHRELLSTARQAPKDTCPILELANWTQVVRDKCYSVEALEQRISLLMEQARPALSIDDAELEKLGKKHMNNIKQGRVAKALNIPGLVVPIPHGVTSDLVHEFLQKTVPVVFEHWEYLDMLLKQTPGELERFFESPHAEYHLQAIDEAIALAFSSEDAFNALNPNAEFTEWLQGVKDSGSYLMVRSTGSEDTRQVANAGGNVSRAYVPAEPKAVCEAMGDVVRSYFSYASLQNRINAGQNPFEHELKLAVTAQELIGEPVGGAKDPRQVPISLVLFTDEPLYSGGEKFRVMRISATHGHGEAVVGSQGIGTDTAILLVSDAHPDQLYVMYDNKEKPHRLAPIATADGVKLEKVANPPSLRDKPALTPELLARLYHWGVVGEAFFDDPATDMEIVIKGDTIYPVQARPIVRQPMLPTYLDMRKLAAEAESPVTETLQTEMLVPGKASALVISDPKEVLVANTIEDAQNAYKSYHKLVIVKETPPENSHPVVNFSGMGMTCLVTKDGDAVDKLVARVTAKQPLAVCAQTAALHLWDKSKGEPESFISKGFAVHPAKIAVSIPINKPLAKSSATPEVPQEVKDFLRAIRGAASQEVALQNLKALQQHSFVQSVQQGKQNLANEAQAGSEAHKAYSVIEEFDSRLQQAFEEAEASIASQRGERRLKPLLQVKVLEALLMAPPQSGRSIGQYSVLSIAPAVQDTKELVVYQKDLSHPAHFADILLVSHAGLTTQCSNDWKQFLNDLEPLAQSGEITPKTVQQFKTLVNTLQKADAMPQWLAFAFAPINANEGSTTEKLQALIDSVPAKDFPFIRKQLETRETLKALRDDLPLFSNPATFDHAYRTLVSHVSPESQATLAAQMKEASPMAQIMALGTMKELVDVYDSAIKSMKGSTLWSDEQKVPQFKEMLLPYLGLLESWYTDLRLTEGITEDAYWTVSRYLGFIQEIIVGSPDDDVEQLREKSDFNVNAAVLSSGADFGRHYPTRLDGVFTLIHQNLLKGITHLNTLIIPPDLILASALPDTFKEAMAAISSAPSLISASNNVLIGLDIDEKEVSVTYNKTLRQHSSQLVLRYDKALESYTLEYKLYGVNEDRRWSFVAEMANLLSSAGVLPLKKRANANEEDVEITLSCAIADVDTLKIVLREVDEMNGLSMGGYASEALMSAHATRMVARLDEDQRSHLLQDVASLKTDFAPFFARPLAQASLDQVFMENLLQAVRKNDPDRRKVLLKMAQNAFNEGLSSQPAEESIRICVNDPDHEIRSLAWATMGHLLIKRKGLKTVEDLLMQEMQNPDPSSKKYAIHTNKVFQSYERSTAEKIAAMGVTNPNLWVRGECMRQLRENARQGLASEVTLSILPTAMKDSEYFVGELAWGTLSTIINDDRYPFPSAFMQEGLKESDDEVRVRYWLKLLETVEKGKGIDLAREVYADGLKDSELEIQNIAKQLAVITSGP